MNAVSLLTGNITFNDVAHGTSFSEWFANQLSSFTPLNVAIALLAALLAGAIIAAVYKKTYRGVLYSPSFALTLILLCLVTTPVVMCIGSNIALSMGMVGALSIVRFRTAVKDPLDTAYMFWALTMGILLGANAYVIAIVAVLGIFYLVLCIVSASHGTILGRTDVMGVDMSGLTVPQAQERWQQKGQAVCQATQLPLTLDGETAGQVSLWELGVSVTPETAAQLAYDAGHSGHFLENGWSLLRSWFRETSLTPPWTADDAALQEKAAELAEQLDVAAVDGACRLEQGKEDGFLVTVPKNGRKIDPRQLADALRAALAAGTLEPVTCAYEVVTAKPVDFDAFAETYATAKNASYNAAADQVEEGTVQVTFDADAAQKLVAQAQPGQEITVPAQIQQPKVSKAALEKVLFRDVLASCTTYVSGAWGRIQNVRKAAQNISGTVLNCGDQFSYNDAIGPTTADYGFYAAPGYVGGKTVDVYGGGVCQVSSTLYYATLKADLEIVMRYCHQYAPGYIKWGCDATVYDGFPDFIFANNTDYPIKIVTYWNDNNVTVEILGTKVDDSYVEMVSETVDVIPWETVYEETDELAPGEQQEIQTPYTGYVVQTWRNVYAGDGSLLSSTFEATSNYESRDQIIRIGKAKP